MKWTRPKLMSLTKPTSYGANCNPGSNPDTTCLGGKINFGSGGCGGGNDNFGGGACGGGLRNIGGGCGGGNNFTP